MIFSKSRRSERSHFTPKNFSIRYTMMKLSQPWRIILGVCSIAGLLLLCWRCFSTNVVDHLGAPRPANLKPGYSDDLQRNVKPIPPHVLSTDLVATKAIPAIPMQTPSQGTVIGANNRFDYKTLSADFGLSDTEIMVAQKALDQLLSAMSKVARESTKENPLGTPGTDSYVILPFPQESLKIWKTFEETLSANLTSEKAGKILSSIPTAQYFGNFGQATTYIEFVESQDMVFNNTFTSASITVKNENNKGLSFTVKNATRQFVMQYWGNTFDIPNDSPVSP